MNVVNLYESAPLRLALSDEESAALVELGRRFSPDTTVELSSEDAAANERQPRIIVKRISDTDCTVEVRNAVGVFSLGEKHFAVAPKIRTDHFYYVVSRALHWPQVTVDEARSAGGGAFVTLLISWYLNALEIASRGDLLRDYAERDEDIFGIKGRVHIVHAASAIYTGSLYFRCSYDELAINTPLNRVLKAALRKLGCIEHLEPQLRGRAQRLGHLFDDVEALRHDDTSYVCDRLTSRFTASLSLAKTLLTFCGISADIGSVRASCFMVPTPLLVEDGIRLLLEDGLGTLTRVRRDRLTLDPPTFSVNPDLFLPDAKAVADVKYKITNSNVGRSDMYQAVAFATAYAFSHAIIISFADADAASQATVTFGTVRVHHALWPTWCSPEESHQELLKAFKRVIAMEKLTPAA